MTRFTVEILPDAERDFREAFLWYFERSPLAADAFRAHVLDAIDHLAMQADMWPANEAGFHFRVLDRFPYILWYEVNGSVATVMAVAHQHRRPNYWTARG